MSRTWHWLKELCLADQTPHLRHSWGLCILVHMCRCSHWRHPRKSHEHTAGQHTHLCLENHAKVKALRYISVSPCYLAFDCLQILNVINIIIVVWCLFNNCVTTYLCSDSPDTLHLCSIRTLTCLTLCSFIARRTLTRVFIYKVTAHSIVAARVRAAFIHICNNFRPIH